MFDSEKKIASEIRQGQEGMVKWSSPSNIALVKYWGKAEGQVPRNPSLSFSLEQSRTITEVSYVVRKERGLSREFYFEGSKASGFEQKLDNFFNSIQQYLPYLDRLHLEIKSSNTFPHSAGIASSASSMCALSLCLLDIGRELGTATAKDDFYKKASFLARLGSGSASRSVYPGFTLWGYTSVLPGSSNLYATRFELDISSFFNGLKDAIVVVSSAKKQVSSSVGHDLMNHNPYAGRRYEHAEENLEKLILAIRNEDKDEFIRITENEALTLHGLMMSSDPGFILLKNGSIEIIRKIREFRKVTGVFISFTLDAGPNVHVIYHDQDHEIIEDFLKNELAQFAENENIIYDIIGSGPQKITISI